MRALSAATRRVEQRDGTRARPALVADELDLPLEGYWRWIDEAEGEFIPLQATEPGIDGESMRTRQLADRTRPTAEEGVMATERNQRLRRAIDSLPPRMKEVLTLTYYEDLGGRAIAELTGVSESRISQLKRVGLKRLREGLAPDLAEDCS
jgi:RNA polymerase sigma factor (sigma-70 family)